MEDWRRGLSKDAKQQEKEGSSERWVKKRAKENLISCWNKLSFITLMEKTYT